MPSLQDPNAAASSTGVVHTSNGSFAILLEHQLHYRLLCSPDRNDGFLAIKFGLDGWCYLEVRRMRHRDAPDTREQGKVLHLQPQHSFLLIKHASGTTTIWYLLYRHMPPSS